MPPPPLMPMAYSAPAALAPLMVPARCRASRYSSKRYTMGALFRPLPFAPLRASAENHGEILCNFFYPPIRGIAVWALLTALPAPCYHAAEATQRLAGWQGAKKSPRNHPQGNAPRDLQVASHGNRYSPKGSESVRPMTNAQYNALLETLAKLVEATATNAASAAQIIREAKT